MATLTEAQKKKLKAHSKSQTATHIKAMAKLMRAGKSFSEAHTLVSKKSVQQKQKQKQTQSQKVVVNIGTVRRRRVKPKATARTNTLKVLQQFAQPVPMTPQRFIYPTADAPAFTLSSPSVTANPNQPRPRSIVKGVVSGRPEITPTPPMTPAQTRSLGAARASVRAINEKLAGKKAARDREAERALMAVEDASSFMANKTLSFEPKPLSMKPLARGVSDAPTELEDRSDDPFIDMGSRTPLFL